MIRPFARVLLRPILLQTAGILLLVLAVFLAEVFTSNLESVLHLEGSAFDVAVLLTLASPEILDLALPLSVLLAVFLTVRESAQRGELLVIAGAGVSWVGLIAFVGLLTGVGAVLSFVLSGLLLPNAHYSQREFMHALEVDYVTRSLRQEVDTQNVRSASGYSFVPAGDVIDSDGRAPILVMRESQDAATGWRYAVAENWTVEPPDENGEARLILESPVGFGDISNAETTTLSRFALNTVEAVFDVGDAYPTFDAMREPDERTILTEATFIWAEADMPFGALDLEQIAQSLARALLVPAAGFIALVAVLIGQTPGLRLLSLPIALGVMAACDVLGRLLVSGPSATDLGAAILGTAALFALVVLLPLGTLFRSGEQLLNGHTRSA